MNYKFIIGKKIGMSRIFSEEGLDNPVTIVEAGPCTITQIKNIKTDGYDSIQVGYGLEKKDSKKSKSKNGHFNKSNLSYFKHLKETGSTHSENAKLGDEFNVSIFEVGDIVNVSGTSKGKGFAGHMKRHNFGGGRASHGKNSVMRKAGSIGAGTWPGRVWPGTRMAGRMGSDKVKIQNLEIIKIDIDNNLLFIKGAIPGANNNIVYIEKK